MIRHPRHTRRCLALGLTTLLCAAGGTSSASRGGVMPQVASADGQTTFPDRWLQGFVRAVSGNSIVYPWAYPGQIKTLLSRTTDGRMAAEWDAEAVPPGPPDEPLTYLWHAGTASGYGAHRFTLSINGRPVATFTSGKTTADRDWIVRGEGGSALSFKTTRVGTFNELFGFMWLTAPRAFFGAAQPRFRVVGEAANSQDYYLGPQEPVRAWTRVRPEQAVFSSGQRAVRVEISHVGGPEPVRVAAGDVELWSGSVATGFTSLLLPAGPNEPRSLRVSVKIGSDGPTIENLVLDTVRTRAIHLLPHSHVDIGYSDPQPEVERKQWKNLRDAVALGLKSASYPTEARFKWNVEGLWSVESYLQQASPAERQAFVDAVRAGTIGLQANYTNLLTGLAAPEELRRWTDGARRLRAAYGFGPIPSAMHSDIPGLSWTVVAALAQSGVRYFSSGPNYMPGLPDRGDRIGNTLKALGDTPFWWTSPSGEERLLVWVAGRGYSWFHGLNTGTLSDRSRDAILDYVKDLVDAGYLWDLIQVRYTIGGDNGPVDPNLPDLVKDWNERFATPRLVISTVDALFAEFERRHGDRLPVMSGDMTPYWEDGAISTAAEEALARAAARRLAQAETLWAIRDPAAFPASRFDTAWRSVILWHEHTWGAADSISQPDRPDVVAQWTYKRQFALDADRLSRELMDEAAPKPGLAIEIVNTLAWPRSGLVTLTAAQSATGDRARTTSGTVLPSQRLKDGRLAVWLNAVPAFGAARIRIERGEAGRPERTAAISDGGPDNGQVAFQVDPETGSLAKFVWRPAVNVASRMRSTSPDVVLGRGGLLDFLYVPGRDPATAVRPINSRVIVEDPGPLVATVRVTSDAAGTRGLTRVYHLVAGSDIVLAEVGIDKLPVRTKESAHLAFPLEVPGGVTRLDLGEAIVEPERTQLPGSCRDFTGVHSVADISGAQYGVSIATLDAPLFEPGEMTDERQNDHGSRTWRDRTAPGTTLYAYLLNNYWHTNYKADQSGPLSFRFAIRPHGAFDAAALRRFSDDQDQPLLVRAVDEASPELRAPFVLDSASVVVSSLRPIDGGRALALRLYNPTPSPAKASIQPLAPWSRVSLADGDGQVVEAAPGVLTLPPRATRVLRLDVR